MTDPKTDLQGTILAQGISLGTDMRETNLNNNTFVIGPPGSFKTRSVVKPNIMQMNSSYVVTDPKGNLKDELGPMLTAAGYEVYTLDFTDPDSSDTYNPFAYVRSEEDVDFLVRSIVHAEGRNANEKFWDDVAELVLKANVSYCIESHERKRPFGPPMTFGDVLSTADNFNWAPLGPWKSCENRFDEMVEELRRGIYWEADGTCHDGFKDPDSIAVKTWKRFRACSAADRTSACAVLEMWSTLNKLGGKSKERLFSNEQPIDIGNLGKKKTALFVVVSDTDRSMDFMVSVFYAQLFKELCRVADTECSDNGNRLKVPVRVILDDFANQGPIEGFETYIAAVRSRDIWLMPICQARSQLEQRYGYAADTIIGCCDALVYLGVNDMGTAHELSERADIPLADVQCLPLGTAMVFVRGQKGAVVPHYSIEGHPNYRFLTDPELRRQADQAAREKALERRRARARSLRLATAMEHIVEGG